MMRSPMSFQENAKDCLDVSSQDSGDLCLGLGTRRGEAEYSLCGGDGQESQ